RAAGRRHAAQRRRGRARARFGQRSQRALFLELAVPVPRQEPGRDPRPVAGDHAAPVARDRYPDVADPDPRRLRRSDPRDPQGHATPRIFARRPRAAIGRRRRDRRSQITHAPEVTMHSSHSSSLLVAPAIPRSAEPADLTPGQAFAAAYAEAGTSARVDFPITITDSFPGFKRRPRIAMRALFKTVKAEGPEATYFFETHPTEAAKRVRDE